MFYVHVIGPSVKILRPYSSRGISPFIEFSKNFYWNKQFQNEKLPTKLDEYKAKINYDVWTDVTNVKYNMEVNYNVHPQTSDTTRTDNRND